MKTYKYYRKFSRILFGLFTVSLVLFSSCAKEKDCKCDDGVVTIKQGDCEDVEITYTFDDQTETIKCK